MSPTSGVRTRERGGRADVWAIARMRVGKKNSYPRGHSPLVRKPDYIQRKIVPQNVSTSVSSFLPRVLEKICNFLKSGVANIFGFMILYSSEIGSESFTKHGTKTSSNKHCTDVTCVLFKIWSDHTSHEWTTTTVLEFEKRRMCSIAVNGNTILTDTDKRTFSACLPVPNPV